MSDQKPGSETAEEILGQFPGEGRLWATIETSEGTLEVELYDDLVPNTVANFVGLATGKKTYVNPKTGNAERGNFYDGVIFHRIIKGFMIQGGDPEGSGRGGPGYRFGDEFHPELKHTGKGIFSMANAGPNTNGSQFFICEVATPHLDERHAVFGKTESHDVVDKLANTRTARGDRPVEDVFIKSVSVERRA